MRESLSGGLMILGLSRTSIHLSYKIGRSNRHTKRSIFVGYFIEDLDQSSFAVGSGACLMQFLIVFMVSTSLVYPGQFMYGNDHIAFEKSIYKPTTSLSTNGIILSKQLQSVTLSKRSQIPHG